MQAEGPRVVPSLRRSPAARPGDPNPALSSQRNRRLLASPGNVDSRVLAGVDEPLVPLVEREVNAVRVPAGNLLHNLSPAVRDVLGGRVGVD
eukprot:1390737-Alexandrium_andersonii.AAC.1